MTADPIEPWSVAYFGLRSNAHQLLAGAPARAVRRRMMTAALMHDRVLLEAGLYDLVAGPRGSVPFYLPEPPTGSADSFQSPRQRRPVGNFSLRMGVGTPAEGEPQRFHEIVGGPAALRWRATFRPFADELPEAPWIGFVWVDDTQDQKHLARDMGRAEADHPLLARHFPDLFVRNVVSMGVVTDLIRATDGGAVAWPDPFHARLCAAHVERGDAQIVLGDRLLELLEPDDLAWLDIAALRKTRGWIDYRKVLRDIEADAVELADGDRDLDHLLLVRHGDALARAEARRPSGRVRTALFGLGVVVGEAIGQATTGVPLAGGVVAGAMEVAADAAVTRASKPRWLASAQALGALRGRQRSSRAPGRAA